MGEGIDKLIPCEFLCLVENMGSHIDRHYKTMFAEQLTRPFEVLVHLLLIFGSNRSPRRGVEVG